MKESKKLHAIRCGRLGIPMAILAAMSVLSIQGCGWDSALYGSFVDGDGTIHSCPDIDNATGELTEIRLGEIVCTPDSQDDICDIYKASFKYQICPKDAPKCKKLDTDNYYCTKDTDIECTSETDCKGKVEHWSDGLCEKGVCYVKQCLSGYKVAEGNKTCVPDCGENQHYDNISAKCEQDDINNCGATNYKCSERVSEWNAGNCVTGVCTLTACNKGYKVVNNVCASDCVENQHYDSTQSKCVADDKDNCGATGHSCIDEIKNSSEVECEQGKCIVSKCISGYAIQNNTCLSDCTNQQYYDNTSGQCNESDDANCGQKGYDCSKQVAEWKSGKCENNTCKLESCIDGYKIVDNTCKPDCGSEQHYDTTEAKCVDNDLNNCGAKGYICSEMVPEWESGACENGTCKLTGCNTGYKVVNNVCVSDCNDNQHYDNNLSKCVADDINNCGATNRVCSDEIKNSKVVTCESGKCIVSECATGYKAMNNVCISDCTSNQYYDSNSGNCKTSDIDNCGQTGYICKNHIAEWSAGECQNNVCILKSCNTGFKKINNECRADCKTDQYYDSATGGCKVSDANNCGRSGYKCSEHAIQNATSNTCSAGACQYNCTNGYLNVGSGKASDTIKCIDPNSDKNFCGATNNSKGTVCADKTVCVNGKCILNSCGTGETLCSTAAGNTCINIKGTDANNCGTCGYSCSKNRPVHTKDSATCSNGICQYECESGTENKGTDKTATTIQCVSTAVVCSGTELNCNNHCVDKVNLHIASCATSGTSYTITCESGYANCDGNVTNGCELSPDLLDVLNKKSDCTCKDGYTLNDGKCVAKADPSPTDTCVCDKGKGSCNGKVCEYTECNTGYYLDGKECKENTKENCGKKGNSCYGDSTSLKAYVSCNTQGKCVCGSSKTCSNINEHCVWNKGSWDNCQTTK